MNLTGKEIKTRIADIADMTEINNHNEALLAGCSLLIDLGCAIEDIRDKIAAIGWQIERLGYLPHDLSTERYQLYEFMMRAAKSVFGEAVYNEFRMAY